MARASLFKYLSYDKLTDKYCNDENASGNCIGCPVKKECRYIMEHDKPYLMAIKDFILHAPYIISEKIANYYASHKKTHYKCNICGLIETPYFYDDYRESITYGYGWWKAISDHHQIRWVCHHCMEHNTDDTCNEWKEHVRRHNTTVIDNIKNKDPDYHKKWFHEEEV